jgi:hypothetical protein
MALPLFPGSNPLWMAAPFQLSQCFKWLTPRLAPISHQPSSLLFTDWLSTEHSFNCHWLLSSDSRTELTWLPQLSFLWFHGTVCTDNSVNPSMLTVSARICLQSCCLVAAVYSCLLRICCLATNVVPLSISRPLLRNECCFKAVR